MIVSTTLQMDTACLRLPARTPTTLRTLSRDAPLVVEFWNVRCTRCPDALRKVSALASQFPRVAFATCALAVTQDDEEADVVDEYVAAHAELFAPCASLLFMTYAQKEEAKRALRFTQLPHCVVLDRLGGVRFSGNPMEADVGKIIKYANVV